VEVHVFPKLLFAIVKNSLSAISTKFVEILVHSHIAAIDITLSLFTDFDITCHNHEASSLHIQKISYI
jgi:hypothetical protein